MRCEMRQFRRSSLLDSLSHIANLRSHIHRLPALRIYPQIPRLNPRLLDLLCPSRHILYALCPMPLLNSQFEIALRSHPSAGSQFRNSKLIPHAIPPYHRGWKAAPTGFLCLFAMRFALCAMRLTTTPPAIPPLPRSSLPPHTPLPHMPVPRGDDEEDISESRETKLSKSTLYRSCMVCHTTDPLYSSKPEISAILRARSNEYLENILGK